MFLFFGGRKLVLVLGSTFWILYNAFLFMEGWCDLSVQYRGGRRDTPLSKNPVSIPGSVILYALMII